MSEYVGYFCTEKTFKNFNSYDVESFDVFRNFDILHRYYKKIVTNYTQSVEDLEKDFSRDVADDGTWCEYIISKNNDIIARIVIWKVNDSSYEIAAVSTDPQYQKQGYATGIVSFCTQKILNEGKTATCTTKADNIPMRKTLEKLGFILKN